MLEQIKLTLNSYLQLFTSKKVKLSIKTYLRININIYKI